ncbi:large ribosomal subunit protein uL24c isoform X2 [Gastrolobium bilobum]|uniref:large ribosomal subunit protein uL24c isoform X2 n=1 Tax=Gastrolobium bilobum TaxID=150636 RepID=UPI002AAF7EFF|nr:large ribosomal subunit protein uL24c isoform X2 [Gastrolobium bilobum]
MAAMAALQSSMTSLSLSSNSFFGQQLSPFTLCPFLPGKLAEKQCLIVMKVRHWERKKCKPNSLPVLHKMHVKVGDTVKVISGHEKGKIGEITELFKHNSTVIGEPGQIIKIEGPIHSSNVMLYSKDQNVASRVGHKILENGKKVRYLIKTGEVIDTEENWKKLKENTKKTEEVAAAA